MLGFITDYWCYSIIYWDDCENFLRCVIVVALLFPKGPSVCTIVENDGSVLVTHWGIFYYNKELRHLNPMKRHLNPMAAPVVIGCKLTHVPHVQPMASPRDF